jgi:GntR family transcriptional regulator
MARYEIEAAHLRRLIERGEFRVGETLPRIADLAEERGVSVATVRRAMEVLEDEGLVRVVRGTGAIVQPPAAPRRRISRGVLVERDPRRGYIFPAASHPGEPWQVHGRPKASMEPAPPVVASHFGTDPGRPTLRRRRVTSPVNEPPFQIVDTWLSAAAIDDAPQAAEPSTGPGGYLDRLEEAGHGPISWEETTRARMPTSEEARLLSVPDALPVLELVLVGTSASTGDALEVTVRVIPADRVELVSTLGRGTTATWPVSPVQI